MSIAYLNETQINENSFIMIEFENQLKEPYFVGFKEIGTLTEATMLLGHKLKDMILSPALFPCKLGNTERFYISNDKVTGKHKGVLGYRALTSSEKEECINQIPGVESLLPLLEFLK